LKKVLPVFILICFLLSGCKVKEYTPVIPVSFTKDIVVYTGDFSFNCKICKTEKTVTAAITNTNAAGMKMTYDGSTLSFSYDDFSYDLDGSKFEKNNIAIVIYEVFDYIDNKQDLNAKKLDNGYRYDGKISIGNFTLIQNDDNSFESLEIKECDYRVEFQN